MLTCFTCGLFIVESCELLKKLKQYCLEDCSKLKIKIFYLIHSIVLTISVGIIWITTFPRPFTIVVGVDSQWESHGRPRHWPIVQTVSHEGGGMILSCSSSHPLPSSLLSSVAGTKTHGPVDEVEHEEHDGEHNKEHIINF